jgi:large subunit ribosomal protein L25
MQSVVINGTLRENVGKKASKDAKKEGRVPCVIYGNKENIHFEVLPIDVRDVVYTPDFKIAEIVVGGKTHRCILKDLQFHPLTDKLLHCDFLELVPGKPVIAEVPVRFSGTAPGVKLGGKMLPKLRRVKVKALPEHLTDEVIVDISKMQLGSSVRVRDIAAPEGVEVMSQGSIPVATIEIPRSLRSAATKEAKSN